MLLWFKEGGGPQFGRVINGLRATFHIQLCNIMIIMCYEGNTDEKRVIISVNKMIE